MGLSEGQISVRDLFNHCGFLLVESLLDVEISRKQLKLDLIRFSTALLMTFIYQFQQKKALQGYLICSEDKVSPLWGNEKMASNASLA